MNGLFLAIWQETILWQITFVVDKTVICLIPVSG